ncbi:class I SAM-dependent methyltransferase [Neoaquamicrobium sediminum]|uniref:class I SAM-dependent methyltransferase n=2 Tax=Neoaquamicrobium sediminum TaxID=1849104 RepID=UPI00360DD8FD
MNDWATRYTPPLPEEMQRVGSSTWEIFQIHANTIEPEITSHLKHHFGWKRFGRRVLDFGCGVGRVALKMYAENKWPTDACDVNPAAVRYINSQLPRVKTALTNYDPPLPYKDASFDAVYSISVWTHMPEDAQDRWLAETARILKPGGIALLTTSGPRALASRRRRGDKGWSDVTDADLKEKGIIFTEYERFALDPKQYPGVTRSYGLTAHAHDYIHTRWGKFLKVNYIKPACISQVQDLVVCTKS